MRPHTALPFLLLIGCHLQWSSADIASLLGAKNNFQMQMLSTILEAQVNSKLENTLKSVPNKTCVSHLREVVQGVKHLTFWALKMFDSSTKVPQSMLGGVEMNLGNYEECVGLQDISTKHGKFSGKYCLVRLCSAERENCTYNSKESGAVIGEIEKKIALADGIANVQNLQPDLEKMVKVSAVHIAVCMPSTCSGNDIEVFLNKGIQQVTDVMRISVDDLECHTFEEPPYGLLDKLTITFLLLALLLVILSTAYDLKTQDHGERRELFLVFSVHSNMKHIMETSTEGDSLPCLHGLRAISIIWVICGQRYLSEAKAPLINKLDVIQFAASWDNILVMLTPMMADTFLLLSGLLLAYNFLNRSVVRNIFDYKSFYIHRFIRLTPVLAVMVLLQSSFLSSLADGPVWRMMHPQDCGSTWWHSLLYIKNYFMPSADVTCSAESWYLSVDTQLYWISPLLLIPLWRNPRRGRQLLAVVLGLTWLIPFIQSYAQGIVMPCKYLAQAAEVEKSMNNMYYATHNRAAPWVVGLCLGYILHRLSVGQVKVRINKPMVAAMWTFVLLIFFSVASGLNSCLRLETEYSSIENAFHNATGHLLWGLGLAVVIFACIQGYGGPVNHLLSMEMWQPISRLSYCMYMVHLPIQMFDTSYAKTFSYFAHSTVVSKFMADVPLTMVIGLAVSLMFEWPAILLEKYFRKERIDYCTYNKVLVAEMEKYRDMNGKEKEKSIS
ncbi:nose resistant to fluoxetine protein 6 [Anabrus simplex]|uniref:nose resistant to fluoxetine protein 6 n=1 Tax=Anabrus simplex TaxID=316456 RepID=UPI0035A36F3D